MNLSGRNVFALLLLLLFSKPLYSQTNSAFFEYPVDSACQDNSNPIFVANQTTPGGSFSASPSGLSLDPVSGAIFLPNSSPGTYQVTHTLTNPSSSFTVSFTVVPTLAAFLSYPQSIICPVGQDSLPVDTVGVPIFGTFSATPPGLVINSSTGTIDLNNSQPGSYVVMHAVSNGICGDTALFSLIINPPPGFQLEYPVDSVCPRGEICPVNPPSVPGFFQPQPGLVYDDTTGCIALLITSEDQTYEVCYTEIGVCNYQSCDTITVLPDEDPKFTYPSVGVCNSEGPQMVSSSGGDPSIFSWTGALISDSLWLDPTTGTFDPSQSTPGSYVITNTTTGPCPDTFTRNIVIFPNPPVPIVENEGDTVLRVVNTVAFNVTWLYDSLNVLSGSTTIFISLPGVYNAVLTSAQGCQSISANVYVGITDQAEPTSLADLVSVYPNPSPGTYQISSQLKGKGSIEWQITDLRGKILKAGSLLAQQNGEIDLSAFADGIYLLQLSYYNSSTSLKLVKASDQ